jgi:choline dehydrogenase-like flavoprotein
MAPYYEQAERLYRVRGGGDPLRGDPSPALLPAIPVGAGAQQLVARLAARGLHPYRLPLACEGLDACSACQGYLCARACKNDADRIALRPALRDHGAVLLSGCEALALQAQGARVDAVSCESNGRAVSLRGRVVVLAAGALQTPALLLGSRSADGLRGLANGSGLVGRNLMRHAIDLWALVRAPRLDGPGDAKAVGFNDLYDGDAGKLGSVQSFGAPIALEALRNQRGSLWRLAGGLAARAWRRFERVPILATIMEDLPYEANLIEPTGSVSPRVRIHYRPGLSERRRRREFRDRLRPLLSGLGAIRISGSDAPKALGHACGTCRFGDDPRASVLDRYNRAHTLDNLYVVDASFFPSSGGINPALTIAANAIRVGEHLVASFGR